LNHSQWNPKARSKDDKAVREYHKRQIRLILVNTLLLELSMHTQKCRKVMQIGIVIKLVRVAMVCVRMLMLPHDGIAKEGHAPDSPIIDERVTASGKVTPVMSHGSHQPSEYGKEKATSNASLDLETVRMCESPVHDPIHHEVR
jgi:hypothetical protein